MTDDEIDDVSVNDEGDRVADSGFWYGTFCLKVKTLFAVTDFVGERERERERETNRMRRDRKREREKERKKEMAWALEQRVLVIFPAAGKRSVCCLQSAGLNCQSGVREVGS